MEADPWIKKLKKEYADCGGYYWDKDDICPSTDLDYALKMRARSGDEGARREHCGIAERYGLKESAENGDAAAQYELAELCLDFLGKREEGIEWLKSAAAFKNTDAMLLLGEIYCGKSKYFDPDETKPNFAAAFELFEGAAKKQGRACLYLGEMHRDGCEAVGLPVNDAKAYYWFRQAANRTHKAFRAKAMAEIARYCKSRSAFRDGKTAFKLFSALAEIGYAGAVCELADCYMRGIGVDKSDRMAAEILLPAALSGNARAEKMYESIKNRE